MSGPYAHPIAAQVEPAPSYEIKPPLVTDEQDRVDAEVAKLDDERLRLLLQRCQLLNRRNACAPIHRLPDECLSIIFLFAAEDERVQLLEKSSRDWERDWSLREKISQTVSHVSMRWRDVALSTPRLWSTAYLNLGRSHQNHEQYISGLLEHFSRMKAAPVDLDLRSIVPHRVGLRSADDHPIQLELDIVSPLLARCRRLTLNVPWREVTRNAICRRLITEMPHLEELAFRNDEDAAYRHVPMPLVAQKLRSLDLKDIDLHLVKGAYLEELTSLRMTRSRLTCSAPETVAPDQVHSLQKQWPPHPPILRQNTLPLEILQRATKLQSLTLSDLAITLSEEDVQKVSFDGLRHLDLALGWPDDDEDDEIDLPEPTVDCVQSSLRIFTNISMPSLRSFKFCGYEYAATQCDDIFHAFAQNRPPLETLSLKRVIYSTERILELLSRLPRLRKLSFNNACISKGMMEGLRSQRTGTRCPMLEELTIEDSHTSAMFEEAYRPYTMTVLRSMVRSRWQSKDIPAISKLVVEDQHLRIMPETRAQFQEYVESLQLNLRPQGRNRNPLLHGEPDPGFWTIHQGSNGETEYELHPNPISPSPSSPSSGVWMYDDDGEDMNWDGLPTHDDGEAELQWAEAQLQWGGPHMHNNEDGVDEDAEVEAGLEFDAFVEELNAANQVGL